MSTLLKTGQTYTYTGTGVQEAYRFDGFINGLPTRPSIAVVGGSSDVFTYQEKHGGANGDFVDYRNSVDGKIPPRTLTSLPEEFRLNITTNASGSIKFYITIKP
jgi:hypothetical protein